MTSRGKAAALQRALQAALAPSPASTNHCMSQLRQWSPSLAEYAKGRCLGNGISSGQGLDLV
jgi:hypothetical protein